MPPEQPTWRTAAVVTLAVVAVAAVLLSIAGAPPLTAARLLVEGSVGSAAKLGDTLMAWVPLALAACGLLVTFAAGLWNIGIEGQIVLGAIGATWAARTVPGPAPVVLGAAAVAAVGAGAAWGLLVGVLRVRGGVNEIFGGLGLDFLATGLTLYLILGPWARTGIASTSGTEPFRPEAWLPTVAGTRLSPVAVGLVAAAASVVWVLLRRSALGLRIVAAGRSPTAAARFGVPVGRTLLVAFTVCGAVAGLAGLSQATGFHHKLVPSPSGGYGFLAILVVLLARQRLLPALGIAFLFAALSVGATQLQLRLDLDSSFAGVLQGVAVLTAVLATGARTLRGTPDPLPAASEE